MILVQRIDAAAGARAGKAIVLFSVVVLLLAAAAVVAVRSAGLATITRSPPPTPAHVAAFSNLDDPACAAALAKARDTRALPSDAAIAASTDMLRACRLRS